ncbi:hypothetical protein PR048_023076 [Dryococelus australis]|uniref:Uncharacterized protein n=1 Tax=Dryococelus australis TaxID=614101 RepID=A0ABQ9GT49_9NEOP|nr:hypothetical protein PR048_023076 [Dryococelus australis]
MRGTWIAGGGDVVVGQEYTDADKGLDDGVEGEVFGFNLVRGAHHKQARSLGSEWPDQELRRRGYKDCAARRGTPVSDKRALLVSWASSPLAVFGGAIVSVARPLCGHF